MMNRVVDTCCCDADDGARAACGPKIRASDCCEKLVPAARTTALSAGGIDFDVPPPALTATVSAAAYFVPKSVAVLRLPVHARAPPGNGPPLFLVHCSLLT
jgi:hypothetical protein